MHEKVCLTKKLRSCAVTTILVMPSTLPVSTDWMLGRACRWSRDLNPFFFLALGHAQRGGNCQSAWIIFARCNTIELRNLCLPFLSLIAVWHHLFSFKSYPFSSTFTVTRH